MPLSSTTVSNMETWNFRKWNVMADRGGRSSGEFISSETTMLAAGPARYSDMASSDVSTMVYPIAVADNIGISQQKMVEQIVEIGARRCYWLTGRSNNNLQLSRLLLNGPSCLRVITGRTGDYLDLDNESGTKPINPDSEAGMLSVTTGETERSFHINLQAELFDRPLGLMLYMIDQRNAPYGAMYMEDCQITSHNFNIAAQGLTIREQIMLNFTEALPVSVEAV